MPERDIESLGVMGWGGGVGLGNSSAAVAAVVVVASPPPPNVWKIRGFMNSDKTHRVLSSNMFVSVLNFLCIPQIGRLSAHGANVKRLLIPRTVLLSGLLRIEEIEKMFLTEI